MDAEEFFFYQKKTKKNRRSEQFQKSGLKQDLVSYESDISSRVSRDVELRKKQKLVGWINSVIENASSLLYLKLSSFWKQLDVVFV